MKKLSGTGKIEANGGSETQNDYPSGGGGRVAVHYDELLGFDLLKVTAYGGKSGQGTITNANAGAGSVYLKLTTGMGELIVDNRGVTTGIRTMFPEMPRSTVTSAAGSVLTDTGTWYTPRSLIGMKLIPDATNPAQSFRIVDNDGNNITVDGTLPTGLAGKQYYGIYTVDGRLRVRNTMTLEVNGGLEATEIGLEGASVLTHSATTQDKEYRLSVKATKVTIDSTSKIDVSERGYRGGMNGVTDASGRTLGNVLVRGDNNPYAAGGSCGGKGGNRDYEPNDVYGSIYEPVDLGSGGGFEGNTGGNGGGAFRLETDELVVDGAIRASGGECLGWGGGGSGGSLYLRAKKLGGTGTIEAKGGANLVTDLPSGGGGRIAVCYDELTGFDLSHITAYGGKSGAGTDANANGGAGTVYLKWSLAGAGEIRIDNNAVVSAGGTPISAIAGMSTALSGSGSF